jgi:peptide-methionine (S)-S-oxide reductase
LNDEQKVIAQNVIDQANNSRVFKAPVVTKIEKAGEFYEAEAEHQDYLEKHPYGYKCHFVRNGWKF